MWNKFLFECFSTANDLDLYKSKYKKYYICTHQVIPHSDINIPSSLFPHSLIILYVNLLHLIILTHCCLVANLILFKVNLNEKKLKNQVKCLKQKI